MTEGGCQFFYSFFATFQVKLEWLFPNPDAQTRRKLFNAKSLHGQDQRCL